MKFTTTIACSAPTWDPSSTFVTIASDVQQIPGGRRVHRHDRDECSRARQSRHDGLKHPRYAPLTRVRIVCKQNVRMHPVFPPPSAPLGRRFFSIVCDSGKEKLLCQSVKDKAVFPHSLRPLLRRFPFQHTMAVDKPLPVSYNQQVHPICQQTVIHVAPCALI